ncbi:MAG TPA: hypothetical protein VFO05_00805 [Candidatus Limnocylindrales bacterium]|nr:hypothetical protein [Candidatus Limnocylindrales bacterium]
MTDATRSDTERGRTAAVLALLAGPLLIVASITVWAISDSLLSIGPFDRAQIGWAVVVPLFLLAPAAAALAARSTGRRAAVAVAVGVALVVGGLAVIALSGFTRIGCTPVSQVEAALHAVPVGLAAGLGFLAAVTAGVAAAVSRGTIAAVVAAVSVGIAGGVLTLLVFGLTYPFAACPYVPA